MSQRTGAETLQACLEARRQEITRCAGGVVRKPARLKVGVGKGPKGRLDSEF